MTSFLAAGRRPTVFAPFEQGHDLFRPLVAAVVSFRVAISMQWSSRLARPASTSMINPQPDPNGRFARLHDPENNPIELGG